MIQGTVTATVRAVRNEWLGPQELRQLVNKKIRATITSAYRRVPYYRDLFKVNNIHPDEIKTARDLQKIPLTTKDDIRRYGDRMLAHGIDRNRLIWKDTTGTTGKPVVVARDRRFIEAHKGMEVRRTLAVWGMPWTRKAHVVHSKSDPAQRREDPWGMLGRIRTRFRRLIFLDDIRHVPRVIDELSRCKPTHLVSHAYNLRLIALHMNERAHSVAPRAIITGGEVADGKTREFLEQSFGCPVYGIYGASELGLLGFECRHKTGFHINMDHVYGEYLANGEPVEGGKLAETVWTTLDNRAMPLIRYRLGDLAIPAAEGCPCGRSLPLVRSIEGRLDDLVWLVDGGMVTPARILSELHTIRGVARFRLVQRTLDRFEVGFIRSQRYCETTKREVLSACRALFGEEVEIRLHERDMRVLPVKWNAVVTEVREKAKPLAY